ncbi:hypothetical protein ACH4GK_17985 [Streptomyces rimosus]|uniref:hypothetical protein n=1 Tax=Streptomyces rimosus TaxID=1927 RepID=UPI0004C47DA7|nr:hypothetical protein [Streptomyces rimosus]
MTSPVSLPSAETVLKTGKTFARDLLERVLSTFLQAFVGVVVVTTPLDASMWYAAGVGGVGAVLAFGKGLLARLSDVKNSASLAKGV